MFSQGSTSGAIFNTAATNPLRKPRTEEIDVFGLTHTGKVRKVNQDHFLIGSLEKSMLVHLTSLPDMETLSRANERLAYVAMVADGVGSGSKGGEASRRAIEVLARYVGTSLECYYTADATKQQEFVNALQEAAMQSHAHVIEEAQADSERRGMATTLTVFIGVWPRAYLLQVGDSRFYVHRDGELTQMTRDQTMAQELVDQGVLTETAAHETRWAHALSSSIGGTQTAPVVTHFDQVWGNTYLLCSDGLTKHVSDDKICERLNNMKSAKQVCEDLLQDALDDGGSDNITIVVVRPVRNMDRAADDSHR